MSKPPDDMGVLGIPQVAARFAEALVGGKDVDEAAKVARMTIPEGRKLMLDPRFRLALERLDNSRRLAASFDREMAHDMLVEAFAKAETSDEIVKVAKELARLHGIDRERPPPRTIDVETGESVVDYGSMTDEQLERLIAKEERQAGGALPPAASEGMICHKCGMEADAKTFDPFATDTLDPRYNDRRHWKPWCLRCFSAAADGRKGTEAMRLRQLKHSILPGRQLMP